eukprot:1192222-Prorocentrum_minimum.AAC.1
MVAQVAMTCGVRRSAKHGRSRWRPSWRRLSTWPETSCAMNAGYPAVAAFSRSTSRGTPPGGRAGSFQIGTEYLREWS